jgi:hypothetical protein
MQLDLPTKSRTIQVLAMRNILPAHLAAAAALLYVQLQ